MTQRELGHLLGYTQRRLTDLLRDCFECRGGSTVRYDAASKRMHSVVASAKLYGPKTASEAVTILQAAQLWNDQAIPGLACPVVDTRAYRREPASDIFRMLLGACARRQVVDIVYLAKTRQLAVSFSPHALVVGPHRAHFRGYSMFELEGESHWWDLVPSRVVSAAVRPRLGYVGAQNDVEWHTDTKLCLRLRADLPEALRQAIRHDNGMDGDLLTIEPIRQALRRYVLADYMERRYERMKESVWEIVSEQRV
ncbi:hypothetical protein [Roseomonas marmotae]|uniref:WYL domain-containing protein n=1 Tax=Roseomonas marmotae TaxID=2768161 RepID=A0ABS3KKF7_9PROT|nr:hypothetical protein [Roseomonas marmotae]MBO1077088.1 hypothetical protein [Roseomonas marmotae]QTI82164.1 hypothetical protein IAI58_22710 [Roseomonas marmotae]